MKDHRRQMPEAFSLLELMASIAILAILGLLIAQVSGAIQQTTSLSNRMVDAAAQARLAFDRMTLDFAALVTAKEVDFSARNQEAGDASKTPGSSDIMRMVSGVRSQDAPAGINRGLSIVGYDVAQHVANEGRPCLLRAARPVNWDSVGFMGLGPEGVPPKLLRYSGDAATPVLSNSLQPADIDYDVLSPGVIRIVTGFQLRPARHDPADPNTWTSLIGVTDRKKPDGTIYFAPPARSSSPSESYYVDLARISAVVVGLVVLDLNSLKLLDGTQVADLASYFDVPDSGPPLDRWMNDTTNLTAFPATFPAPVRQSVRVYQRAFPIQRPSPASL